MVASAAAVGETAVAGMAEPRAERAVSKAAAATGAD